MGLGFFQKFAGVEANKGADALMTLLVKWDPTGASEAEKRMIAGKLSEFCVKCEEARKSMQKEEADVTTVKKQAADKVVLAKMWQVEINDPATDEARKKLLNEKLPALMDELKGYAPKIDKEVREAELAKKLFETYDAVVVTTNQKLQQKIAQSEELTSNLEIAKAERSMAQDQVDAARVLNGLQTAHDSFDVASSVITKQTDKTKAETAGLLREADLLTATKKDDSFVAAELAKVQGTGNSGKSVTDQLADLEAKLK